MQNKFLQYQQKRSCTFKLKHETLKDALIKLLEYRDKDIAVDTVYKCLFCNDYHVGHKTKGTNYKMRKVARIIKEELSDVNIGKEGTN